MEPIDAEMRDLLQPWNPEDEQMIDDKLNDIVMSLHHVAADESEQDDDQPLTYVPETSFPFASAEEFDPTLVWKAKQDELESFKRLNVYRPVLRDSMVETGAMISTKWVITNKGTTAEPKIKARFVGREFNDKSMLGELFAGTPGLSVFRYLLSRLATWTRSGLRRSALVMDVKTAFLNAPCRRDVYIELPDAGPLSGNGKYVGKLNKALYGTRDAPMLWQDTLRAALVGLGFVETLVMPGVFRHPVHELELSAHVDDLFIVGLTKDLRWFQKEFAKLFTTTATWFGMEQDQEQEVKYLNRAIKMTESGVTICPDTKHAEEVIKGLGLKEGRAAGSPNAGEDREAAAWDVSEEQLEPQRAREHRGLVARLVYMAQDRMDLGVSSCTLARTMSKPREIDNTALKRVGRYLLSHFYYEQRFDLQEEPEGLDVMTDSDWATCRTTRRSVSGGLIKLGAHVVQFWARTQPRVALSSGEAELYAAVRGLAELQGMLNLVRELRGEPAWGTLTLSVDASACRAILLRRGSGSIKHLSLQVLWVQEVIKELNVQVMKIHRESNHAHVMASSSVTKVLDQVMGELHVTRRPRLVNTS